MKVTLGSIAKVVYPLILGSLREAPVIYCHEYVTDYVLEHSKGNERVALVMAH